MKKITGTFLLCTLSIANNLAQKINVDSLAKVIVQKDIVGKVEKHSDLVQRLEWTSPWFLAPTVIAILGLAYAIFLYFWGLRKKVDAILQSQAFQDKLDETVKSRIAAIELKIKSKPICLIYLPGKNMTRLTKLLSDTGFSNVKPYSTLDTFDIEANTVVVFNDEEGDFTDGIAVFINGHPSVKSKGRFFYFGPKRFTDPTIRMRNFANSDDTLTVRLYESLTFA